MRLLFFPYLALAICFLSACETAGTPEEAFGWQPNGGAVTEGAERNEPSSSAPVSSEPFTFEGTGDSIVLEITETELSSPVSESRTVPEADTPDIPDTSLLSDTLDTPDANQGEESVQQESLGEELQSVVSPSDDPPATTEQLADVEIAIDPSSVTVALLLPLQTSSPQVARIAADMRKAAEMALFALNLEEITLIPFDTGGTVDGAREAMENAIAAQSDIILGPLYADSVRASAPLAAENNLTMIAFSNDFTVLDENVLLLSLSPEQDVERILSFAMEQGIFDFAAMLPNTAYGERVRSILTSYIADTGARLHGIEFYSRDEFDAPYEPARRLAALAPPVRALLLADSGQSLRIASSALAYNDIAPPKVQLLGTHLWDDGPGIFEEPSLRRGWFPKPHSEGFEQFEQQFEDLYNSKPESIAGLTYDAVHLVGLLVLEGGDWRAEPAPPALLLSPAGFTGIHGLFRFLPDGRSQHSLGVWEIADEEKILLQAPKRSFSEGS